MCRSMVNIQSPTAEIRRGKKKERRRKKIERNYGMKILWSALLYRATIKKKNKLEMWANAQRDSRPAEHIDAVR